MHGILSTQFLCNIHKATAVISGEAHLPDSIAGHNDINPLCINGLHETAMRGEFISCTEFSAGTYTEQTHDTLSDALAYICNDNDPTAYAYTATQSQAHGLLFITYNKP